ncbi:hypothetical protein PENFLA_c004G09060 [Penicillium flavigenum]|uniref:Uncharacterized protein n=1 Tax=Penicillium flavigenum TaxID=254877 RepID=A0A1V6TRT4_9EURO|nr:hypothetical protein PENFLA_c004G09060 [Penicillium flavigenum]
MAEKEPSKESLKGLVDKMDPEGPTIYNVWKQADGLFKDEDTEKWITFMARTDHHPGFVRVVGGDEGFTTTAPRTFLVPPNHNIEVFSCKIMFTQG